MPINIHELKKLVDIKKVLEEFKGAHFICPAWISSKSTLTYFAINRLNFPKEKGNIQEVV